MTTGHAVDPKWLDADGHYIGPLRVRFSTPDGNLWRQDRPSPYTTAPPSHLWLITRAAESEGFYVIVPLDPTWDRRTGMADFINAFDTLDWYCQGNEEPPDAEANQQSAP